MVMSAALSKPLPHKPRAPRTIPAGEFKARCLQLMDEVAETQQPIIVTKRGKVVGQFVPMVEQVRPFRSIFGRSPAVQPPSDDEWRKIKSSWADEWEESTTRLAKQLRTKQ